MLSQNGADTAFRPAPPARMPSNSLRKSYSLATVVPSAIRAIGIRSSPPRNTMCWNWLRAGSMMLVLIAATTALAASGSQDPGAASHVSYALRTAE